MNRQCVLHELVCRLTKRVLSARSQVGYNKKHNFELWYNVEIYLADRQKSRRGAAVEKHCSGHFLIKKYYWYASDGHDKPFCTIKR